MPAQLKGCPLDAQLCGDCLICTCFRKCSPGKEWSEIQDKFILDNQRAHNNDVKRVAKAKAALAQEEYERSGSRAHTFATVGLAPNDPKLMLEILNTMRLNKDKPYFKSGGSFTIEYHGAESNHAHIHILLDKHERPSKMIKYLSRMFFKCDFSPYVDIQRSPPADYNKRKSYIEGNKALDTKEELVNKDRDLRNSLEIEHIYYLPML